MNITGITEKINQLTENNQLPAGDFRSLFMSLLGGTQVDSIDDIVPERAEFTAAKKEEPVERVQVREESAKEDDSTEVQHAVTTVKTKTDTAHKEVKQGAASKEEVDANNHKIESEGENSSTLKDNASSKQSVAAKQEVVVKQEQALNIEKSGAHGAEEVSVTKIVSQEVHLKSQQTKTSRDELLAAEQQPVEEKISTLLSKSTGRPVTESPIDSKTTELTDKLKAEVSRVVGKEQAGQTVVETPNAPVEEKVSKLTPRQEIISQALGIQTVATTTEAVAGPKSSGVGVVALTDKIQKDFSKLGNRPELLQRARTQIVENIQKVIDAVAAGKTGNTLTVRLDPPELGKVTVKVSQRSDGLNVRVVPESADVEANLQSRAHELGALLNLSGVRNANIEIATASEAEFSKSFSDFLANQDEEKRQEKHNFHQSGGERQQVSEQESDINEGWVA